MTPELKKKKKLWEPAVCLLCWAEGYGKGVTNTAKAPELVPNERLAVEVIVKCSALKVNKVRV